MLDVLKQTLAEEQVSYQPLPHDPLSLAIRFEGLHGEWVSVATVREERQEFVFYSVLHQFVEEDARPRVAEYLMRANYGLVVGNFEMDFDDGEVRFRTGIDVEDDRLSEALTRALIYSNWVTMDRYLPGLQAVVRGEMAPNEAIEMAENSADED